MDIIIDHALPEDAIERVTMINMCDNSPGSHVFHVPAHWHKVNRSFKFFPSHYFMRTRWLTWYSITPSILLYSREDAR